MLDTHVAEPLKYLGSKHVEHFVYLQQVLEEQVDHVREKPGALAEILVLEHVEDLGQQSIKAFIGRQNLLDRAFLD